MFFNVIRNMSALPESKHRATKTFFFWFSIQKHSRKKHKFATEVKLKGFDFHGVLIDEVAQATETSCSSAQRLWRTGTRLDIPKLTYFCWLFLWILVIMPTKSMKKPICGSHQFVGGCGRKWHIPKARELPNKLGQ